MDVSDRAAGFRFASRFRVAGLALGVFMVALAPATNARAACAEPMACICSSWPTGHVLRGTLRDDAGGPTSEVEVHDIFAGEGVEVLSPGDVIRGVLDSSPTCGLSLHGFAPGDEVLALWQGRMPEPERCPEYSECASARCRVDPAYESMDVNACRAECADEVREVCPADDDEPRLVLVPWAPVLELGSGRTLESSAAAIFASRLECSSRFPVPAEPCNDVGFIAEAGGCSVGAPGSSTHDRPAPLAFALLGFTLWCATRRTRRS